jgi:hypothetical protein
MRANRVLRLAGVAAVVLTVGSLTACGASGTDETGSAPSPTNVQPSPSASPCWGKGTTTGLPGTSPKAEVYVGLSEQDALDLAEERQQTVRVAGRDGECFALTMDYQPDRVNLYIESDQVVAATLG